MKAPLYKTESTFTWKAFLDLNIALERQRKFYWSLMLAFEVVTVCMSWYYFDTMKNAEMGIAFMVIAVLFTPLLCLRIYMGIRAAWKKAELKEGAVSRYEFFGDHFIVEMDGKRLRVELKTIAEVILTRHNIYLMDSERRGYILEKEKCSPELVDFLSREAIKRRGMTGRRKYVGNI